MAKKQLQHIRVAILACNGFEEHELFKPRQALLNAGAEVDVISPEENSIKAWRNNKWTKKCKVDIALTKANPNNYQALILPGGVINPDKLRTHKAAIAFVKKFLTKKKLIAAICHGPLTLIETGKLKGREMTSYHSIKTDLKNAGVVWKNKEVVKDKNLITSRSPKDIPAFNKAIIETLVE